jgi:Ca-activated chloride channel homolog
MDTTRIIVIPERPVVRNDRLSELDIVVEISSHVSDGQARHTASMNLCLVVDRSGSMQGDKLDTAKQSCVNIFRRLAPGDLLTVVVFDDDVSVVVNPQTPRSDVESRIRAIPSGGMTNLSLGWYQGLLELQTHMESSHHSRLFLLSDGQANVGETKRAAFSDTATRARDVGITASTIGIGSDYQEDLLEAIASSSGGRFWNISDSGIEDIIEEEFQGALTTLFDRPRVKLSLPAGVRISKELNDLRKMSGRYRLRPIQGEDTFNFALRLEVDPEQVEGGEIAIGATLLDGERIVVSDEQTITLGSAGDLASSPAHPLVRSVVEQFASTSSEEKLLEQLDSGNLTEMKEMLTAEIARLRTVHAQLDGLAPLRAGIEMDHVAHFITSKAISQLVMELVEGNENDLQVQRFMNPFRKSLKQEGGRIRSRRHNPTTWDDEAPVILNAIALADILIANHPEDSPRLTSIRERFREYLADN